MRLQAQVDELGVLRIVVVFLGFDARIGNVRDLDFQSDFYGGFLNEASDFQNRKPFRELIVNATFARRRRIQARQLNAANGIANVEETSLLAALSVDGQRVANDRFNAKPIQNRPEDFVIIKTVDEDFVERDFVGDGSIDDALVEISGAQAPSLAGEHDVVTVVHFGEVVKGAWLLGERKQVFAAIMFDGDIAFFDVDIRSAVFTHRSKLNQVTIRLKFAEREEQIQCSHEVIGLREHRVAQVDH